MGTIFLLRHGETEYHAQERMLGRLDIGLNERGREQARRTAAFFADVELAAVYSSPLKRCLETAAPSAAARGLDTEVMEGLMEVDMGDWDGRSMKELFASEGERVGKWLADPSSQPIPGGEDFGAVRERVTAAVREIVSRHPGDDRVLLVTHGGPIRGVLCEALGMGLDHMFRLQIDLASISAVEYFEQSFPDSAVVTLVNQTLHLEQGGCEARPYGR